MYPIINYNHVDPWVDFFILWPMYEIWQLVLFKIDPVFKVTFYTLQDLTIFFVPDQGNVDPKSWSRDDCTNRPIKEQHSTKGHVTSYKSP